MRAAHAVGLLLLGAGCAGQGRTEPDDDGDGYASDVDCDDGDAAVNPGVAADGCDGRDDDCDGALDEDPDLPWYPDLDGDGFGYAAGGSVLACERPADRSANAADCADDDATRFPGNDEACDTRDNDCDGEVDEGLGAAEVRYGDADGDGAGDPDDVRIGCGAPEGTVDNAWDCDDGDASEPVFVAVGGRADAAGTLMDPLGSVQGALDRARRCVWVDRGTYVGNVVWGRAGVAVRSLAGPEATILEGAGGDAVVIFGNSVGRDAILEGFTLTGGTGHNVYAEAPYLDGGITYLLHTSLYEGGGIAIYGASPTLRDLRIVDNVLPEYGLTTSGLDVWYTDSYGGGMYVESGAPLLEDLVFDGGFASRGGGLFVAANTGVEAHRVRFLGARADYGAGIQITKGTLTASNVEVNACRTTTGWDGIVLDAGTLVLSNAVLLDLTAAIGSWGGGTLDLRNSILAGNQYGVYDGDPANATSWTFRYDDVYANASADFYEVEDPTGRDGNLRVSPKFASFHVGDGDPTDEDLTLLAGSPCVDAGDPASTANDPDGTRNDMGIYGGPASW